MIFVWLEAIGSSGDVCVTAICATVSHVEHAGSTNGGGLDGGRAGGSSCGGGGSGGGSGAATATGGGGTTAVGPRPRHSWD